MISRPAASADRRSAPRVRRSEIFGWSMYDVADSAFTTVIVSTLYPLYYGSIVVGDPHRADFLWGLAASISEIVVAVLAPILGAVADFSASRKRFLGGCALIIIFFTAALSLVGPGMAALGLGLFIAANIGFAGGGIFIDSFLPGISNESNAGRISGVKWALGYGGGLLSLALCLPLAKYIVDHPTPQQIASARLIPLVVAAYYTVAVLPTFLFLRDHHVARPLPPGEGYWTVGFRQLRRTFRHLQRYRELFKLFVAFLFYNDGIVTVIYFSARYAKETLGFTAPEISTLFIAMNVVSAAGALAFGFLADRMGQKRTILVSLSLWIAALLLAYFSHSKQSFYAVATLVGIGIGSCQSVTRSLVALFTPEENAAEFYGFLGVSGKAMAFLGPFTFGTVSSLTGSQRAAILSISVFFVAGIILLSFVDEQRGKQASRVPVDG
ncbi:MAG: MFS transporter [Acidobacteria bacterium]|nr:MFS transporter [Acidobacteriota bacterium]